jgi:hypothetical protein
MLSWIKSKIENDKFRFDLKLDRIKSSNTNLQV